MISFLTVISLLFSTFLLLKTHLFKNNQEIQRSVADHTDLVQSTDVLPLYPIMCPKHALVLSIWVGLMFGHRD